MTSNLPLITRRLTKIIVGTALAVAGTLAFLAMGWVPPELAAILGSRRITASRTDDEPDETGPPRATRRVRHRRRRPWRRDRPFPPPRR